MSVSLYTVRQDPVMTTTDPGLLTALDTLTSAAKAAPPGTVAVWADIWAVAVRGLEAALDADVRAFAMRRYGAFPASRG